MVDSVKQYSLLYFTIISLQWTSERKEKPCLKRVKKQQQENWRETDATEPYQNLWLQSQLKTSYPTVV